MRYVISRKGENKVNYSVKKYLLQEKKLQIDNFKGCLNFKKNVKYLKKLRNLILSIKREKKYSWICCNI